MTPLEKIRNGILQVDWSLVVDGFQQLTGEELLIPFSQDGLCQELINRISRELDRSADLLRGHEKTDLPTPEPPPKSKRKSKTSSKKVTKAESSTTTPDFTIQHGTPGHQGKKQLPYTKSRFVDDYTLFDEQVDHSKSLATVAPPKQRRPKPKTINAKCDKCGKSEKVAPVLAPRKVEKDDDELTIFWCSRCVVGG